MKNTSTHPRCTKLNRFSLVGCARVASHVFAPKTSKSYQNVCFWHRQPHSRIVSAYHCTPSTTPLLTQPHTNTAPAYQPITALPAPLPFSHSHTAPAYHCTPHTTPLLTQSHSPSLSIHSPHHSPPHTATHPHSISLSLHSPPHTVTQPQPINALPIPLPSSHSHTIDAYHCTPLLTQPHNRSLSLHSTPRTTQPQPITPLTSYYSYHTLSDLFNSLLILYDLDKDRLEVPKTACRKFRV